MNFYRQGLVTPTGIGLPEAVLPLRNQVGEIIAGVQLVRSGESRVFKMGADALQEQPPSNTVAAVVRFGSDLLAGLLVVTGVLVLANAAWKVPR